MEIVLVLENGDDIYNLLFLILDFWLLIRLYFFDSVNYLKYIRILLIKWVIFEINVVYIK